MDQLGAVRARVARFRRAGHRRPPVVDDLSAWCDESGVRHVTLSPSQPVRRHLPHVLATDPHPSFGARLERSVARRLLVALPNARLVGADGLVVLPSGEYVVESVYGRHHLDADPSYRRVLPSAPLRQSGDYFSLIGKFSNNGNYYHWIHDGMLRLHEVVERLPAGVKYVVPLDLPPFARELLHLIGLRDDQLVSYSGDDAWELERLWFASLPPSGAEIPAAVSWFRHEIAAATAPPSTTAGQRLYISRAHAAHCRVVNEEELLPVLERHGIDVITTDRMSVADQARAFSAAELIVAPHGAGMTNLIFAPDTCQIVEITEPVWATEGHAYVFWSLAETIGQRFSYVVGEPVRQRGTSRANLRLAADVLDRALSGLAG